MKLTLVDHNPEVVTAWQRHFSSEVTIRQCGFEEITDCIAFATAGNSFGMMDGGVDKAVAEFDPGIENVVQTNIRDQCHGELLVGQSLLASMRKGGYEWLLYTPTMRVPMSIRGTDNVYKATWAVLNLATVMYLDSVAMPGFGFRTGQVPAPEVARQMSLAWENFNNVPEKMEWPAIMNRHNRIKDRY